MKVICIDDVTDILNFGDGVKELTWGKEYEIIHFYQEKEGRNQQVIIRNDKGINNDYRLSRFLTLEEFRDKRLNDILDKTK